MIGETSVRHTQRTTSSSGASLSEPETRRLLMTPDEVLRMPTDEVLIFTRGCPAIHTRALQYFKVEALKRCAEIPPRTTSDRIVTAPSAKDADEEMIRFLKPEGAME